MQYLKKTWIRIIVSLFGGGLISEIVHISTGDPNRARTEGGTFVMVASAIILYGWLTSLSKKAN